MSSTVESAGSPGPAVASPPRTAAERAARGKAARAEVPRSSHAAWEPGVRQDPVRVLEKQGASRVPELVPIRYGRMLASPFAFFRGSAAIMAGDLARTPRSGITVQLCGDAHVANFGGFAAPDRELVFDINDFDETFPGPWEWDVKRLAASVEIAGRHLGFKDAARRGAVLTTVRSYREAMRAFAPLPTLHVWYARLDAAAVLESVGERVDRRARTAFALRIEKARAKDHRRAFSKLTVVVDGRPRIISDPPLITPIEELLPGAQAGAVEAEVQQLLRRYRTSLQSDRRRLLDGYRYGHLARKVVGVGSVGTRAWIVLLRGRDDADPLFLQAKEAQASVLERFLKPCEYENQGERVVRGQRLMQASSDIFLGWQRVRGEGRLERDFYVRQLHDWKGSLDAEKAVPTGTLLYARICGETLARAHARSGDRVEIAGYLGKSEAFDEAIADFAKAYADQNDDDYAAFTAAIESGRLEALQGF